MALNVAMGHVAGNVGAWEVEVPNTLPDPDPGVAALRFTWERWMPVHFLPALRQELTKADCTWLSQAAKKSPCRLNGLPLESTN